MSSNKVILAFDIVQDIKRYFFTYFVLVLVVASAFSVIYFTHMNRQTTSELEVLLTQRDELDIEWRNLIIEQNSLSEHSAIETKAQKQLNMQRPTINSEIIIKLK